MKYWIAKILDLDSDNNVPVHVEAGAEPPHHQGAPVVGVEQQVGEGEGALAAGGGLLRVELPLEARVHDGDRDEVVVVVRGGAEGRAQVRHVALLQAAGHAAP